MAASRLFAFLSPSIVRNHRACAQIPPKFNRITCNPSARFRCYTSSALSLDSDASRLDTDVSSSVSPHPWPEWVNFVDRLKSKGYFTQNASVSDSGAADKEESSSSIYTEMNLVKDGCLSFGHDRFDILQSLSTQDIRTIVEKSCPNLLRKAVNSSKRLRAYLNLDEGDVCSSCNLRGACDRANVVLNEGAVGARTVDVLRIILNYALDPVVFSEENKPPGRELIESSARKLLSELIELGETPRDPDIPNPESITLRTKKSSDLSDGENSLKHGMLSGDWICTKCNFKNFRKNRNCCECGYAPLGASISKGEMKRGDWTCPRCNFMNFARNMQCLQCRTDKPANVPSVDGPEKKKGDWDCPRCNFMNFARNMQCPQCSTQKPANVSSVDGPEKKKGDWDCPRCTFLNFAKNRQCFRCQEPRPQRQLREGDWECPECDFHNFFRNKVCKKCNLNRPTPLPSMLDNDDEHTWKRPY